VLSQEPRQSSIDEMHPTDVGNAWNEDVLKRIVKLEECVEKLISGREAQPGLHYHQVEDKSRAGSEMDQASHRHRVGTSKGHLEDQQKKIMAARDLLLEVATYQDDLLKEVLESVESLAVKIRQMDITIQGKQLVDSEGEHIAARSKSRQVSSGEASSQHSTEGALETSALKTFVSTITDLSLEELKAKQVMEVQSTASQTDFSVEEFDTRLEQAETNMKSTAQEVNNMDKKLERFCTALLTSMRSELEDLERKLRAETESHVVGLRYSIGIPSHGSTNLGPDSQTCSKRDCL